MCIQMWCEIIFILPTCDVKNQNFYKLLFIIQIIQIFGTILVYAPNNLFNFFSTFMFHIENNGKMCTNQILGSDVVL